MISFEPHISTYTFEQLIPSINCQTHTNVQNQDEMKTTFLLLILSKNNNKTYSRHLFTSSKESPICIVKNLPFFTPVTI